MTTKTALQECILVIIANGFDELSTITLITSLRQAGLCVKSLGMTNGLTNGAYGICLMPDLTIANLENTARATLFRAVILPESEQCLAKLEVDPRLHYFLQRLLSQGGQIRVNSAGRQFLKKISVGDPLGVLESNKGDEPLLLSRDQGQSIDLFTRDILHRMGQPAQC